MVLDAPDRGNALVIGSVIATLPAQSAIAPAAGALVVVALGAGLQPLAIRLRRTPLASTAPALRSLRTVARRTLSIVAAALVVVVAGPLASGFAIAASVLLRRLAAIRAGHRGRAAIERALPDAMDLLVLNVRAGLTPFRAVCDLAASGEPLIGGAFGEVVRRTERGHSFADALVALPEHLGPLAIGLADVIATSDRHGLPLGPVLDQLTIETRAARRRLDQADARKLPVRLSFPLVMCTLPSFVLLAIAPAVIAALSSLGATAW